MLIDIHTHKFECNSDCLQIYNGNELKDYRSYFSVGLHPWEIQNSKFKIQNLKDSLSNNKCLAVGEIGLDKLKGGDFQKQIEVFNQQLKINEEFNLPVIIHSVKSLDELLKIKSEFPKIDSWIIHGCRKGPEVARQLLDHGFYLSFGASLLNENSKSPEALKSLPLEKVFFETDDSEIDIKEVYSKAAEVLNMDRQDLERLIFDNFKRVFKKYNG